MLYTPYTIYIYTYIRVGIHRLIEFIDLVEFLDLLKFLDLLYIAAVRFIYVDICVAVGGHARRPRMNVRRTMYVSGLPCIPGIPCVSSVY